jgi:hypothetical protein
MQIYSPADTNPDIENTMPDRPTDNDPDDSPAGGHPPDDGPSEDDRNRPGTGPRGGVSTVSPTGDMVRKNFWIETELEEKLRKEAFDSRISEAEIIRRLLRTHYGVD